MRLAVFSDIHGNLPAFEAAIEHAKKQRVDQIIIAGDLVIGAPDSHACWQLAQTLDCPILRGNNDRYLSDYGTSAAPALWETEQFAPVHWAVNQFSDAERASIAQLPLTLRLPESPDLFICHASARQDNDSIYAHTPEDQLQEMFPATPERYIVRGHNHAGQIRMWDDRFIITCGSIGLPLDGNTTAQYLLLEQSKTGWHIRHQSVPYDLDDALHRFTATGYLDATGPIGRLYYKELATGGFQFTGFLRTYEQWSKEAPLSLDEAYDRFLNM